MLELIKQELPAIITGLIGIGAYLFEKRKKNAELQQVESSALSSMQQAYDKFVQDSNQKFDEMKLELTETRKELELSRKETAQSRIEIQELKQEIEQWQNKYEDVLRELRSFQNNDNTTSSTGQ